MINILIQELSFKPDFNSENKEINTESITIHCAISYLLIILSVNPYRKFC